MSKNKKKQAKEHRLAQSLEALTQNGIKEFRFKEYAKAIVTWEKIPTTKRPISMLAEAHFRLGLKLFYGAAPQEGLTHLQNAAQSLPDDPIYTYHLGLALHRSGNTPGALDAYQTARKKPGSIAARAAYPLALALLQSGQDPAANPAWKELTPAEQTALGSAGAFRRRPYTLPPEAPLLWRALASLDSDNREQAQAQLEQVAAADVSVTEKGLAHYYLGVLAVRADDLESARRAWEAAAATGLRLERLSANLAETYQRRAEDALAQGDIQTALAAVSEAKRHCPEENTLDELLAQIHQQLGYQAATLDRWNEAQDHWQTAVKLDSGSFRLAYNLALAYEKSGNFLKAGETWREALRRRPRRADHPDALGDDQVARLWQHAAECYSKAGEFDEVGRIYQQAIKWAPENLELRLELAENALREGRLQLASNELERILERDPKHVPALVRMGEVCFQDESYWWNKKAPTYWQKALELDPKNTQARQFLAEWHIEQAEENHRWQKCDESIQNYQKSLEFRPGNVKVLSELFTCHLCLKQETQADEYIQQALVCAKNLDDYASIISALLLHEERHSRAREVLALTEARLPDIPVEFYINMAGPLLKKYHKEQADFWLQKAIAKATPQENILTAIADIAMDFDEDTAYEYAQKALAQEKTGQAHVILGVLESKRGNKQASKKHFREAERIAHQTNDEELEYRIEAARIYLDGPGNLMRRLMDVGSPDLLDDFFELFGKGLK
ncbi:MAG: tetratricopeptide repeat protein [Anaerolineae bacterium]|nr:tetratricopeptide repeat protein [Anaerolineae bacterium]